MRRIAEPRDPGGHGRPPAPARSWPTRPRASRSSRRPARGRSRLPDPQPVVFPRDDGAPRPPDRVVVLHRPPAADDGRRWGFEFVIFRAERGALPGDLGVAPRADRRGRGDVPLRPAARRSVRRSIAHRATQRQPIRPSRCRTAMRRSFTDRRRAQHRDGALVSTTWAIAAGPAVRPTMSRRPGWRTAWARRSTLRRTEAARPPRPATAGSTSGRPAVRTTTRGPRCPRPATLTVGRTRRRGPWRPPGSTTSGATSSRSAVAAGTGSPSTSTTART